MCCCYYSCLLIVAVKSSSLMLCSLDGLCFCNSNVVISETKIVYILKLVGLEKDKVVYAGHGQYQKNTNHLGFTDKRSAETALGNCKWVMHATVWFVTRKTFLLKRILQKSLLRGNRWRNFKSRTSAKRKEQKGQKSHLRRLKSYEAFLTLNQTLFEADC